MSNTTTDLQDEVNSVIESLSDAHDTIEWDRHQALGVTYEVSATGDIQGIRVQCVAGGPNVELHLYTQTIEGHWGSEDIHHSVRDDDAREFIYRLVELYEMGFNPE